MPPPLDVLVADDEPKICRLLEQLLQAKGCTVRLAQDGLEALSQFRLFAPFYQVDRRLNRTYDGAGVGLTLAKRYVELHNGAVQLSSDVGNGTTVVVTLPRPPASPALPSSEPT